MYEEKRNRDQRKSARCTLGDSGQRCELKIGSCVVPAELLDESAGGFSVLVNPDCPTDPPPPLKQNRDERKSPRCTVVDSGQRCELKIGSCVVPAELLDESAGGFSVLVNHLPSVAAKQKAQLYRDGVGFNVRIIYVMEVEPKKVADAADTEQGPWFRVGLHRLGEVAVPGQPKVSLLAGKLSFRLKQCCPSGRMLMVIGVFLAVVALVVAVGLVAD